MSKNEKIVPIILIILLAFLMFQVVYAIFHNQNYNERVNSGNERWKQVEERIKQVEESCNCGRYS